MPSDQRLASSHVRLTIAYDSSRRSKRASDKLLIYVFFCQLVILILLFPAVCLKRRLAKSYVLSKRQDKLLDYDTWVDIDHECGNMQGQAAQSLIPRLFIELLRRHLKVDNVSNTLNAKQRMARYGNMEAFSGYQMVPSCRLPAGGTLCFSPQQYALYKSSGGHSRLKNLSK